MTYFEWFNPKRFVFQITLLILLAFLVFEAKYPEPSPFGWWIVIGVCIVVLSFIIIPDEKEEEET